jgi:hypothetical protein
LDASLLVIVVHLPSGSCIQVQKDVVPYGSRSNIRHHLIICEIYVDHGDEEWYSPATHTTVCGYVEDGKDGSTPAPKKSPKLFVISG